MPPSDALRLAVQLHENLHAQIRTADEKIRALFAGSAIFVAALTLTGQQALPNLWTAGPGGPTRLPYIAYAVLLATLAFSLISAVVALRPRVTNHGVSETSLFYFADICGMTPGDYVHDFTRLSEPDALRQILQLVHANAKIVRAKYRWTRRAATGFATATIVWVAVQLSVWFA
ncbi:MAG: Pycsar system effector family protein [Gammaproteobacteria bacterium]